MRLIVTRPQPEAGRWVEQLAQRGVSAHALPLIAIEPMADPAPGLDAWGRIGQFDAVMFVSAAAVRHFFAAAPPGAGGRWGAGAWATGPGTAQALLAEGLSERAVVQPAADAAQFDSEALWQVVHPLLRPGQRVLIVRGADANGAPAGRDWLAERLAGQGVWVEAVAVYRRAVPSWRPGQHALARAAAAPDCAWLFSSSEAIRNLAALIPHASWQAASAIATHDRIAQAARAAGFGVVCLSRPTVDAVAVALESFG